MREYSEYINKRWNEWNERFEVPFEYEFQLRTMFELEEQYNNTNNEHVKTKAEILHMIQRIQERCRLRPKIKIYTNYPCENCIFISSITDLYDYEGKKEAIYSCCKPKHPRFKSECNKNNNWQYYISREIYNNIETK